LDPLGAYTAWSLRGDQPGVLNKGGATPLYPPQKKNVAHMSHQNRYAQKYWVTLDPGNCIFLDICWMNVLLRYLICQGLRWGHGMLLHFLKLTV
jgi:hypothetical protein